MLDMGLFNAYVIYSKLPAFNEAIAAKFSSANKYWRNSYVKGLMKIFLTTLHILGHLPKIATLKKFDGEFQDL